MKLKKIASLMLAGIMAVSMLAGCKSGTTTDEEKNPTTPATPSVVTYANDALSGAQKNVLTFKSSADLDTILKDVATNADNLSSANIESTFKNNFAPVESSVGTGTKTLSDKVMDKLSGIVVNSFNSVPADKVSQKSAIVYRISGALEEKVAIQKIVDHYADSYIKDDFFPDAVASSSTKYSCTYSAEISALKVESPEHNDQSAWVVAMVFTQNVKTQANAE